jgi:hypothetical protein
MFSKCPLFILILYNTCDLLLVEGRHAVPEVLEGQVLQKEVEGVGGEVPVDQPQHVPVLTCAKIIIFTIYVVATLTHLIINSSINNISSSGYQSLHFFVSGPATCVLALTSL